MVDMIVVFISICLIISGFLVEYLRRDRINLKKNLLEEQSKVHFLQTSINDMYLLSHNFTDTSNELGIENTEMLMKLILDNTSNVTLKRITVDAAKSSSDIIHETRNQLILSKKSVEKEKNKKSNDNISYQRGLVIG